MWSEKIEKYSRSYIQLLFQDGSKVNDYETGFELKSATFSSAVVAGNSISIGDINISQVSLVYSGSINLSGQKVTIQYSQDGESWYNIGVFRFVELSVSNKLTTAIGYDSLHWFGEKMEAGVFASAHEAIKYICYQNEIDYEALPEPDVRINFNFGGLSYGVALGYLSALWGKNAIINRYGKLELLLKNETRKPKYRFRVEEIDGLLYLVDDSDRYSMSTKYWEFPDDAASVQTSSTIFDVDEIGGELFLFDTVDRYDLLTSAWILPDGSATIKEQVLYSGTGETIVYLYDDSADAWEDTIDTADSIYQGSDSYSPELYVVAQLENTVSVGGTEAVVYRSNGEDGHSIAIENPLIDEESIELPWEAVRNIRYRPGRWTVFGWQQIEAGDEIIIDGEPTICTQVVKTYDGGWQTEITASGDVLTRATTPTAPTMAAAKAAAEAAMAADGKAEEAKDAAIEAGGKAEEAKEAAEEAKAAAEEAKEKVSEERAARIDAIKNLKFEMENASGVYKTVQTNSDGSTTIYTHDLPALSQSTLIIKENAAGIAVSRDGGETYLWGFNYVTGEAIAETIYADAAWLEKLFAQDITASGTITGATIIGGTIDGGTITGNNITGSLISGTSISGGSVSGTEIKGGNITGTTIKGNEITGGTISGTKVTGGTISGTTVTGTDIQGGTINGATITGGSLVSKSPLDVDLKVDISDGRIKAQGSGGYVVHANNYSEYRYSDDPRSLLVSPGGIYLRSVEEYNKDGDTEYPSWIEFYINDEIVGRIERTQFAMASGTVAQGIEIVSETIHLDGHTYMADSFIDAFIDTAYDNRPVLRSYYGNGYLGTSTKRWHAVYADEVVSGSDRKIKNHISYLADNNSLEDFVYGLRPAEYTLKNGTGGRKHLGFYAQDVAEAASKTVGDLAMFKAAVVEGESEKYFSPDVPDDKLLWTLNQNELIPALVDVLQKQNERIKNLEKLVEDIGWQKNGK